MRFDKIIDHYDRMNRLMGAVGRRAGGAVVRGSGQLGVVRRDGMARGLQARVSRTISVDNPRPRAAGDARQRSVPGLGQLTRDGLIPDLGRLPENLGGVLVGVADDDVGRGRLQQPAEPGGELRAQRDRDRAGDVGGGEVAGGPHIDQGRPFGQQRPHPGGAERLQTRIAEQGGAKPVDLAQAQEVGREAAQAGDQPLDEGILIGCLQQRVGGLLPADRGDALSTGRSGAERSGAAGGPHRRFLRQRRQAAQRAVLGALPRR